MTSILNVDTIADKAGTGAVDLNKQQTIKAHCRFNMQTDAVTGSFNISSCTDNGSGESINTLTNAMNDGLYTVTATVGHSDGTENTYIFAVGLRRSDNPTTTTWTMQAVSALISSSAGVSPSVVCSMISGDLA
tara:strand:- start:10 stop:408 length:399 start_codon:yes stop_codon:yes gene_type:complete